MQKKTLFISLAIALTGAVVALFLHLPLPWLMGPLLFTAMCRYSGLTGAVPGLVSQSRARVLAAAWVCISCRLCSAFGNLPMGLIVVAIAFALLQNYLGSKMLVRFGGVGFKTAWFSSSVGGASEMSTLAERYGAEVDKVASAHSLRVLMVVVSIPFAFQYLGGARS